MRQRPRIVATLWVSLEEPRWVTLAMLASYTLTFVVGVIFFKNPHGHITGFSSWPTGLLLISSAVLGVPSAWRGAWWAERAALIAWIGGWLSAFVTFADIARDPGLTIPIVTACMGGLALLFGLTRLLRVWQLPYAPGKGPETPEQEMIVEDAARLAVARELEKRIATTGQN